MIREKIIAALLDLESEIDREKVAHGARMSALQARKNDLKAMEKEMTPECERVILHAQKLGLL